MNYKKILDRQIEKLKREGLLEVIDLLLVSPELFEKLRFSIHNCKVLEHPDFHHPYIQYDDVKIMGNKNLQENIFLPYIYPSKIS